MSNPTSSFGWQMPTASDLVTDLPADFETFGQAVDTTLADLKGGTTGQVLAKNSNTDMDFVWTAATSGDITGVSVTSPITGGGTSGDVTIGISASAVVPTQTGNSGKYLTTDGTTSSWGTISAGGMTSIASGNLTGASVAITSIAGTYTNLQLVLRDVNTSNNATLLCWFNSDTGNPNRYVMNYTKAIVGTGSAFAYASDSELYLSTSAMKAGDNNNAVTMEIYDYANTSSVKNCLVLSSYMNSATAVTNEVGMVSWRKTPEAITRIDLAPPSGTFSGGTYVLYGVK